VVVASASFAQAATPAAAVASLSDRVFTVRALGNRCLDVGGAAFLGRACARDDLRLQWHCGAEDPRTGARREEPRRRALSAGSPYCIGVAVPPGQPLAIGQPLELRTCDGSAAQRFALDGDAILTGAQAAGQLVTREYTIEPAADSTNPRARLVVGERDLSDAEYFRFRALDGSDAAPTSGFVRVQTEEQLDAALGRGGGRWSKSPRLRSR
jgi:hypothetical protein